MFSNKNKCKSYLTTFWGYCKQTKMLDKNEMNEIT